MLYKSGATAPSPPMVNKLNNYIFTKIYSFCQYILVKKTNLSTLNSHSNEHKLSQTAHEKIMSMVHSDKDVTKYYYQKEMELTLKIYDLLVFNNFPKENLLEKVHIVIGIIENYCHEVTYHNHKELNYNIMSSICVDTIIALYYTYQLIFLLNFSFV